MDGQPRRHSPRRASILIVDDHEIARSGLRRMLAGAKDLAVIGEAVDGREALELARRLCPNMVLMDVRMPDLDGITATRMLKQDLSTTSVIMVTMYQNADYLYQALKAGAAGYLLKDASKRQVLATVRQVLWGGALLHPELTVPLLRRLAAETTLPAEPPLEQLTPREREVLCLVVQGKPNHEIAAQLRVSPHTVKARVEQIIAKLGVSDRTQAAVRAVEFGYAGHCLGVSPSPGPASHLADAGLAGWTMSGGSACGYGER